MPDPYRILGLDLDADDAAVEAAYRAGLKRCPPERDPAGFQALRAAYEALRSERDRVAHALFDTSAPTTADVLERATPIRSATADPTARRPPAALFAALLRGED